MGDDPAFYMSVTRYCVFRHLDKFDPKAGLYPLARQLDAELIGFEFFWKKWESRHWRLGDLARRWGNGYASSTWNALSPFWDDLRILRHVRRGPAIIHFLWGEFASPHSKRPYHRKGAQVAGTFHCSARRLPEVLRGFDPVRRYDAITLMSKTQEAFFLEKGFPAERMRVILHGVDTAFFCPEEARHSPADGRLRLLLVGDTERDHAFAGELFRLLPKERFSISVKTKELNWPHYRDCPHVRLLPRLSGEELRQVYRDADLLVLPLLDCTANNAALESMACGTPVMVNRVGGAGEYVCGECNVIMESVHLDGWIDHLLDLQLDRDRLDALRTRVRTWAMRFEWACIVPAYREVYEDTLAVPADR